MNKPLTKEQRLQANRRYIIKSIKQMKPTAYLLNVKLVNNPFLKNQDKFQFLVYQLNEYNKRVQKKQVTDQYQMASYQKLHSMVSDISQVQTKNDQIQILNDVYQWYKEQNRLVEQRRSQGQIRYQMTNDYRKVMNILPYYQKQKQKQEIKQFQLPSQLVDRLIEPYKWGNRTSHKQLDIPLRRLNQYKRKVINIAPFIQNKQLTQPSRVTYPIPPKYQQKQQQEQPKQGQEGQQNKQSPSLVQGQQGQTLVQDGQNKVEGQQQVIGMPEQQAEDPEDQQPPEQVQDKLAPKNKIFTSAITKPSNSKYYQGQYMQYRGKQSQSERSLQQRYLKLQQQILIKQRQDKINIELAHQRARKKSKMVKQIQKKLQDMMHKPKFIFSQQQPLPQQKLSKQDEIRFGFTMNLKPKPKYSQFDLTNNTTSLPRINDNGFDEKSIRRDRIKSLKGKFSKLLNLSEYEQKQRQASVSMCQYTSRKRGFSQIIKHHSKSKERINQLDEVTRIKQKLTRNKIGVNIRALSQGLCLPDSQQNSSPIPQNIFPNKQLPSNPFMVETKKKKKKK